MRFRGRRHVSNCVRRRASAKAPRLDWHASCSVSLPIRPGASLGRHFRPRETSPGDSMTALLTLTSAIPTVLAQATDAGTGADENTGLGVISWIVVGLIAGFLGRRIVNKRGEGVVLDIILGLVGSLVGGFLFHLVGIHRNGSFFLSLIVA